MRITPTDLLLLALLSEAPSYGWELDEKLKTRRADLWAEYSRPHLYYSLRKLHQNGYVDLERDDDHEARRVYKLTNKGEALLVDPNSSAPLAFEHTAFSFDLLLAYPQAIGKGREDFEEMLEKRREALQEELTATQELWRAAEIAGDQRRGFLAVIKHRIKFLKSELDFLKWLEKEAPDGWQSLAAE